jgi:hypothetical protein
MLDQIFWREVIDDENKPWSNRGRIPIYDKNPDVTTWLYIPRTNSIENIPPYNQAPREARKVDEVWHYDPENPQTSKYSNRIIVPCAKVDDLSIDNIVWQMIKASAKETDKTLEVSTSLFDLVIKARLMLEMNDLRLSAIISRHKLRNIFGIKFINYHEIPERQFYAVCEPEYLGRIPMKGDKIGFYLFNPRGISSIQFIGDMYDISMVMES